MIALPQLEIGDADPRFDEAVIIIDGREEETITIECEGALDLADRLIRYVNAHDQVMIALATASEVLRTLGAPQTAAEIARLSKTIGAAA